RDASRKQDGFMRAEFFEQIGRPGHFAIVETWRDQKAFDARDAGTHTPLLDGREPIRVSGYDQRPYKTLSIGTSTPPSGKQIVYVMSQVYDSPNTTIPTPLRQLSVSC